MPTGPAEERASEERGSATPSPQKRPNPQQCCFCGISSVDEELHPLSGDDWSCTACFEKESPKWV